MKSGVRIAALLLAGVAAVGATASAAPTPAEIIKSRQENLKAMGGAMKAIVDQVKTGKPDPAVTGPAGDKIAALSKELATWFPAGTGPEAGVKTAAKPEIWSKPEDFKAAAAALPPEADKLAAVTKTADAAAIGAQLQATGKACGGCHKPFRVPPPPGQ